MRRAEQLKERRAGRATGRETVGRETVGGATAGIPLNCLDELVSVGLDNVGLSDRLAGDRSTDEELGPQVESR